MDRWVKALREQVSKVSQGEYQADPLRFANAPEDIAKISADLDALAETLADRERKQQALAHEIHHRVKNNLQIVTSLLKLQSRSIADPMIRQPLEQAQIRMGALALIHRLHYEQEDAFKAEGISVERLLTGLCAQLRNAFQHRDEIILSCRTVGDGLTRDRAIPLTLFTVEAVTNAYAHGFPDGRAGTIAVDYSLSDGEAILSIRDDGVGFEPQSDCRSMGRQLLAAFANQMRGKLTLESATTGGAVVALSYQACA